ncbi:prephenate dehydrogenase/arogenate dehydrogenase family protein [Parasaccharibacter sp. TMW2.1890]|uniref:prephenate dehydrogenase/arogenate dehydrogenase family protein n=1 Tax=Parasaccharibacter sp. TMW2.1890 TaxID=2039289 RepID=UPI0020130131|nr:prephenate dehydrogenase/arogenate dehydrogenase family protein [Parasaccharibacter sp. TMW2.1890]MCL1514764.1 cyclohexadienyl dehydrogenase [Parasaccharibacter sp. TMW2.1890]
MADAPLFDTLTIIGPGLIGSSILRRARQTGTLARRLITADSAPAVLQRARELDLADEVTASPTEAAAKSDAVILCIPTGAIRPVAAAILPHMRPGSILSDVASVRSTLGPDISALLPEDVSYVPAHPMAGTEYSGPDAGFATLFENRWTLLVPPAGTPSEAITTMETFWQRCGARTRQITDQYHDQICAMVSHLPHLLAFTICDTADRLSADLRADVLEYAASGFRDFTRIAASDPTMWRDIFLTNRDVLLATFERFEKDAHLMVEAIRNGDSEAITERIRRGRRIRQGLIENKQA